MKNDVSIYLSYDNTFFPKSQQFFKKKSCYHTSLYATSPKNKHLTPKKYKTKGEKNMQLQDIKNS